MRIFSDLYLERGMSQTNAKDMGDIQANHWSRILREAEGVIKSPGGGLA